MCSLPALPRVAKNSMNKNSIKTEFKPKHCKVRKWGENEAKKSHKIN